MKMLEYHSSTERIAAAQVMIKNYDKARAQLQAGRPGLFGKRLDNKARKLALKLGSVALPQGMNIAWATPEGWGGGPLGYRGQSTQDMLA